MEFKLGYVSELNEGIGIIITSNSEEYYFNSDDVEDNDIKIDDNVLFRPEIINGINRAFFVKKDMSLNEKKK